MTESSLLVVIVAYIYIIEKGW